MERPLSTCLDNIYHNRYLLFHMEDSVVISSQNANWHDVRLDKIRMLELVIRNQRFRIRKADLPSSFVEFVQFRTKGMDFKINTEAGLSEPVEINTWTIGWSDGQFEHLVEFDFSTGQMLRVYDHPCTKKLPSHFHRQSKVYERIAH